MAKEKIKARQPAKKRGNRQKKQQICYKILWNLLTRLFLWTYRFTKAAIVARVTWSPLYCYYLLCCCQKYWIPVKSIILSSKATYWSLMSICFVLLWEIRFLATAMFSWLFTLMSIGVCGGALIPVCNLFSHIASCVAELRAMYSTSVVNSAKTGYFFLSQLTAIPDIINRFPVVQCLTFISPALARQLSADLSYLIQRCFVPLRTKNLFYCSWVGFSRTGVKLGYTFHYLCYVRSSSYGCIHQRTT